VQGSQNKVLAMTSSALKTAFLALSLTLASCGGGGGGGSGGSGPVVVSPPPPPPVVRLSPAETGRFLTQATFGATETEIESLRDQSFSGWIASQQSAPVGASALTYMDDRLVVLRAANAQANLNNTHFYEYFWREAATAPDQLRQRVRFALSEIFVVSFADPAVDPRGMASYYDMLGKNAFGNFRTLLEDVSLHPMMGVYLTHLGNIKEDPATGRTPDENYAREVMQLMSLGVFALNNDGTVKKDAAGNNIISYTPADITELAKVFTGLSWFNATPTNSTFAGGGRTNASYVTPMIAYPNFHSLSAKTFLTTAIPASTTSDTSGELKIALDAIFNHPNVGPFIGKQLIQRLVTSNPSPAYVDRVATVFNNNGQGVRGDMAAVIRAILLDNEARNMSAGSDANFGKIREPILRLSNVMRTFGATSVSSNWLVGSTSASTSFGQSPLAAPSVFNFYRPGYSPPNTKIGNAGLVAPEMQIVDEVTSAGYANTMQSVINAGIGTGNDVRATLSAEVALANDPAVLAERMNTLLLYGSMSAGLKQRLVDSLTGVTVPASTGTNQAAIDAALLNRAKLAIYLTMVSPDYLIQR
jgi:uncharacterized protein (DUF1800 family)